MWVQGVCKVSWPFQGQGVCVLLFVWDEPASVEELFSCHFQACFWGTGVPGQQHPNGDVQYSGNAADCILGAFFLNSV